MGRAIPTLFISTALVLVVAADCKEPTPSGVSTMTISPAETAEPTPAPSPTPTTVASAAATATSGQEAPQLSAPSEGPLDDRIAFVANLPAQQVRRTVVSGGADLPNLEVYTSNPDGTDVQRLTDDSALDRYPSWSPDG